MNCPNCRKFEMSSRIESDYRYVECGLKNVVLHEVATRECGNCGNRLVSIPRVAELHQALARCVAEQRARLSGAEVRFLRKHIGWSGRDLAARMGVDPATVSRWENGHEPIGPAADRALRLMAMHGRPVQEYPLEQLADVAQPDAAEPAFGFRVVGGGWSSCEFAVA